MSFSLALLLGGLGAMPAPALAQSARNATLQVTVVDQSGAIIVNARVIVQPIDPTGPTLEIVTNDRGEATSTALTPGRYALRAEFPGFEPRLVDDVRLRAGSSTRREMKLALARMAEDVTVGQDPRERALDPRGNAFGNLLTREQIEALPDDPDEMEAALKEMAGPGATLRVDGFRGGRLPPKSQIQSIRFRRDLFAAENHGGGMVFVDLVTRPGGGPLRGSVDFMFRDESLNARNAFAPRRSPEQQQNGTFTVSGTLKKDRTGFSFTSNGVNAYDSKTINAALPQQDVAGSVRRPADRANFMARVDHALTGSHTLRSSFQHNGTASRNLGVGDFDLPARAYSRDTSEDVFRISQSGPIGRNFFNETRVSITASNERVLLAHRCADTAGARRLYFRGRADRGRASRELTSSSRPIWTMRRGVIPRAPASCSRPGAIAATTRATWAARSLLQASTTTRPDGRRRSPGGAATRSSNTHRSSSAAMYKTTCVLPVACR